tara:strand:+ start:430 stop:1191 length:762 start_codon:yes stop_codon:yes gene_type:complete
MKECKEIKDNLLAYKEKSLSEVANSEIRNHLKSCNNCTKELEELTSFLSVLENDKMENPSANLRMNFEAMLAEEISKNEPKIINLKQKNDWKSYLRIAASVLLIVSAFMLGKYQSNKIEPTINNSYEQKVLASLENSSASQRILAISNAEKFSKENSKILEALINRLFFDENTNVRLSAAEALSKFSSETIVRDAFIKALETDKNTTVQIELIQILSKIEEKRALKPMEKMLENEETPLYVKQQLQLNIPNLL